jgi:hypothetical protein
MSIVLGSGFTVVHQTAKAAVITYPYTNTLYDNAYSSIDDKYSSNYGKSMYDYDYYPAFNNNDNNNTYTNDDKYSSNYGESDYDYAYHLSYNNNHINNTYTNDDKYSEAYSKPSNTYNNYNNENNNDMYYITNYKYLDSYSNSDGYSKYPTNDKLYECQKGPLEGYFTNSVEFCIVANSNTK